MDTLYYLDTSIFGGYFDKEFCDSTQIFWQDMLSGRFRGILSVLTLAELQPAPAKVINLFLSLPTTCYSIIEMTDEIDVLADRYVNEKIVGPSFRADALHVAAATIAEARAVISWNYKHLVNLRKIEAFNGVNLLAGYRPIDIRTPAEVLFNEFR